MKYENPLPNAPFFCIWVNRFYSLNDFSWLKESIKKVKNIICNKGFKSLHWPDGAATQLFVINIMLFFITADALCESVTFFLFAQIFVILFKNLSWFKNLWRRYFCWHVNLLEFNSSWWWSYCNDPKLCCLHILDISYQFTTKQFYVLPQTIADMRKT